MSDIQMPERPPRAIHLVLGGVPAPEQKPPDRGSTGLWGFISNNAATILTFVGGLVTAGVAFFGGVFQKNEPPQARIALVVGMERLMFDAQPGGDQALPVVPVGRIIPFSGSASIDPDDPIERREFRWTVRPLSARNGGVSDVVRSGVDARVLRWTFDEPGSYEITLDVTDDHRCNALQRLVAEGGCRKSSTAITHLVARVPADPVLVVTGIPSSGAMPFSAKVDATGSRAFDGKPLQFNWTIDHAEISIASSVTVSVGRAGDALMKPGRYVLGLTAEDRWGYKASATYPFEAKDEPTRLRPVEAPAPPSTGNTRPSDVADPLILAKETVLGTAEQPLRLPGRIVTNGHALTILASDLDAGQSVITSFDPGSAERSTDGKPGDPGPSGTSPGEKGQAGSPGGDGKPGASGRTPGPIRITARTLSGHLTIRNNGQPGAEGGSGGAGGRGGFGARGVPSRSGFLNCAAGPGYGGNGGAGGPGGTAGAGGDGGNGGTVTVTLDRLGPDAHVDIQAAGGLGGDPGKPGPGGPGGEGGLEGQTGGFCAGAGRRGAPGMSGSPGAAAVSGRTGQSAQIGLRVGGDAADSVGSLTYPKSPR